MDQTDVRSMPSRVPPVETIRAAFPALRREHHGYPVAYFDGPGGTQIPGVVSDAVADYLLHHNANTHWHYPTSMETDAALAHAREVMAAFFNAAPNEVAFGANMTTLTFHVARALGRTWGPGDEIVVTELDHHGNVAPWRALARERGVTIRSVAMDVERCELDAADLERAITPRTRLLAIGAASNALGTVSDVAAAAELAHAIGALVFVDAVHYAPHVLVDVPRLGCDLLACSAYKFYGPHVGVLYGRNDLLNALDVPKLDPAPDEAPERLETGTQNHEGIVGTARAVEFLAGLSGFADTREGLRASYRALHERGQALLERLWEGLGSIRGVSRYGPPPSRPRTPTVIFTIDGRRPADVSQRLARRGLFVSSGDFYAPTVMERLGRVPDGVVRVGCACYSTVEEVDRLVEAVAEIAP